MDEIGFGYETRASFASDPERSRGRLIPEPGSRTRTAFQRDRDRIIHSAAFRRLQFKTQVFVYHEGDHFRTRLTHTLEVAQISRSLARALRLDQDLAEAIALAHDLGHTPFGHSGERTLDACMRDAGGFDHNAQTLRIVTALERRYAAFDGLNLTWEALEGLAKHNGPLTDAANRPLGANGLPWALERVAAMQDLWLWSWPSLEAQAAAIADDIAYDAHDLDDALRAGLICLDELGEVPFTAGLLAEVRAASPRIDAGRTTHELVRRAITRMVEDVLSESRRRIDAARPQSSDAARRASSALVAFSGEMAAHDRDLKTFLMRRVYRHPDIVAVMSEAETVIADLFGIYRQDPRLLPPEWRVGDATDLARRICDYVAGMTDRFCLQEYVRHVGRTPGPLLFDGPRALR